MDAKNSLREGFVQFYLADRAYGYIRDKNTKEEFYVQQKHLLDAIKKGDHVQFGVEENNQGLYATQVRIVKEASL